VAIVTAALAAFLLPPAAKAESPVEGPAVSPWAGTVEFYGLIPWADTTTTVRGFETSTALNPSLIFGQLLQSAFAMRASGEYNRIGLLTDLSYTQLGAEPSRSTARGLLSGRSTVTSINGIYDLALRYRLGDQETAVGKPGQFNLVPYAGVRLVEAQLTVAAELNGQGPAGRQYAQQGSLSRTWAQPLVGLQGSVFLSPKLRAFARGDIAGFGLAGAQDLSGNAQLGLGYAVGNSTTLNVSMRYFGQAWNNGASPDNGYTSHQYGPEVSLKLFF
jgi:hypothetical protein